MSPSSAIRRATASACVVAVTSTGCAFHGLNSLPLPGAVGRGPHAQIFHIEFPKLLRWRQIHRCLSAMSSLAALARSLWKTGMPMWTLPSSLMWLCPPMALLP